MTLQHVDNLIFDVSGIIYRTYNALQSSPSSYSNRNTLLGDDDEEDRAEMLSKLALHAALNSMQKYFNMFKPKRVVACFDRSNSWRKIYMGSSQAVSVLPYKGNRRQNQTPAQKEAYEKLITHMKEFEQLLRDESGVIILAADMLEADDCVAGFVQYHNTEINVIATNDSDMSQLITPTTHVCNLTSGELVECEDPKFLVFEKIFRGDRTDNIMNIMPGVRKTVLQKAYTDQFTFANLMAEKFKPATGDPIDVADLFEENKLLIDLTNQPPAIRDLMMRTVKEGVERTRTFNFWKFANYCKRHKLNNIHDNLNTFRPLLKGGYLYV